MRRWILGLSVNTEITSVGLGSPVQQEADTFFKVQHHECVPLMNFLTVYLLFLFVCLFALFWHESVYEYYGNRRQSLTRKAVSVWSTGRWCSSHSIWAQTAVMRFMKLITDSDDKTKLSYITVHISVQTLFFRATRVQCKNLRSIVSYCLWVKSKYKRIETLNSEWMPVGKAASTVKHCVECLSCCLYCDHCATDILKRNV